MITRKMILVDRVVAAVWSFFLFGCDTPSPLEQALFAPGGLSQVSAMGYAQRAQDPRLTQGQRQGAAGMANLMQSQADYERQKAIAEAGQSNIQVDNADSHAIRAGEFVMIHNWACNSWTDLNNNGRIEQGFKPEGQTEWIYELVGEKSKFTVNEPLLLIFQVQTFGEVDKLKGAHITHTLISPKGENIITIDHGVGAGSGFRTEFLESTSNRDFLVKNYGYGTYKYLWNVADICAVTDIEFIK